MEKMRLIGTFRWWYIFYNCKSKKGKIIRDTSDGYELPYRYDTETKEIGSTKDIPKTLQTKIRGLLHTIHKRVGV